MIVVGEAFTGALASAGYALGLVSSVNIELLSVLYLAVMVIVLIVWESRRLHRRRNS